MSYKINGPNTVKRLSDGAIVTLGQDTKAFRDYQKWESEGNMPEPKFTPKEIIENEKQSAKEQLLDDLRDTDKTLLKLIVVMYQVGVANGLWKKSDFEAVMPGAVDVVQDYRQKLTEYESLSIGEIK